MGLAEILPSKAKGACPRLLTIFARLAEVLVGDAAANDARLV